MNRLPPLNAVRAFEAAARLMSIRKAAAELFVTAGAVSRQVKVLEEFLGTELFTRGHRAVALTPAGERYFAEVSRHLAGLRNATIHLKEDKGRPTLKLRAYTTFAMRWLIPRLASFHGLYPDIDVQLSASLDAVDFDREDVDAAVRLGSGNWQGQQADRLMQNLLVPVCSPRFAAERGLNQPDDLAGILLLHSLARPDDWARWLSAAGAKDVNAYAGIKYESSAMSYQAAAEGHGVAIAQKALVADDLKQGRLCQPFAVELDMAEFTYYFVFPIGRERTRELEAFRQWLKTQ
ncbi:transcriptional regulator GcvA [Azospirillum sp.]|uniref:transcriptional regulator GcvA n=1 Tax=Azospirillum sp. TaxID=34012 RepID=UPI003D758BA2